MGADKDNALKAVIAEIEGKFGKGSIMKLGDGNHNLAVEVIPTGALALDAALGIGGVPRGRIIEVYGPESSGKTTLALQVLAETQAMGGYAAFIDAEHALDPVYAARLGVDLENLYISQPDTGEQALEICDRLVLHEQLLTDNEGWSVYITNCVEKTNRIITGTYRNFLLDIKTIRGQNSNAWVDQELEQIYFLVDRSFKVWIREIDPEKDSREEKAKIWFDSLQKLLNDQVKRFVENATYRDCLGIKPKDNKNKKGDKVLNVFIAYNKFNYWLKQNLGK